MPMPSVKSSSSSRPCAGATTIAPSAPTRVIASAMTVPYSSEAAESEAMYLYCSYEVTGVAISRILATTKADDFSSPRCSATALCPFETNRSPSFTSACVSTVDVVVPSPARESVLIADCSTRLAPMFSQLSDSLVRCWR